MGILAAGSSRSMWERWVVPLILLVLLLVVAAAGVYLGSRSLSALLVGFANWLHVLATVVWIGYFLFAGFIYLPVLERQMEPTALRSVLEQVSARLRPFFGGALLIFLVTGTYLMFNNANYAGLGNFFANPWSVLIVIKHVLVLAFLALAVIPERALLGQISEQPAALKHFRWALQINAVLGGGILLLTAIAQS